VCSVLVTAHDGADDSVGVYGSNVGAISKIDGSIGRHGHALRICQFGVACRATITAISLVAGQAALT
jgi:hypothetical protein